MQTVSDLLSVIEHLPADDRVEVIEQLDEILDLDEGQRELALGLLALDLAPFAETLTVVVPEARPRFATV